MCVMIMLVLAEIDLYPVIDSLKYHPYKCFMMNVLFDIA